MTLNCLQFPKVYWHYCSKHSQDIYDFKNIERLLYEKLRLKNPFNVTHIDSAVECFEVLDAFPPFIRLEDFIRPSTTVTEVTVDLYSYTPVDIQKLLLPLISSRFPNLDKLIIIINWTGIKELSSYEFCNFRCVIVDYVYDIRTRELYVTFKELKYYTVKVTDLKLRTEIMNSYHLSKHFKRNFPEAHYIY